MSLRCTNSPSVAPAKDPQLEGQPVGAGPKGGNWKRFKRSKGVGFGQATYASAIL